MQTVSIVGAGISGLALGQFLRKDFYVSLFESSSKPGGLIKCDNIGGNLFHRVGGHVFNTKNKEVFDWFWSFFDREKEFAKTARNAKIWLNKEYIGYPIENHLYQLDRNTVGDVINDLLNKHSKGHDSAHFEEFLISHFGLTLYNLYFKPYNSKIWDADLTKIPLDWLEGKLPMPNVKDIILDNVQRIEENEMVHSTFYYPQQGGSQFIADRLSQHLEISFETPIHSIRKEKGSFVLNDVQQSDFVVYTGDVRKLCKVFETENKELKNALEDVQSLASRGTSNLFCACDDSELSWLYVPEEFTKAHRIIYTGNFSPSNNGGTERKTCVVEFAGKVEKEIMELEIKKLPGNLVALASNHEPNSYVLQEHGTRKKITDLKALLEQEGFFLLGRFAEWEYYNMDKAIEAALSLKKSRFA